ncbi:hypothetical protein AC249_AIPGENE16754 [Exaiptasia diaphana]|nr:hypothetical protein AC249_AIPGENE16754 [Exaiptasia diaphana]
MMDGCQGPNKPSVQDDDPWAPKKEPSCRDPKERGPLYQYYSTDNGALTDSMDLIEENANDILDVLRHKTDPESYSERERFETYRKVNDFFGIFTIYLCMMDAIDRDYKDEEFNPERLSKYNQWLQGRIDQGKKKGNSSFFSKFDIKLQTHVNLHMNKAEVLEMTVNHDDDAEYLVGADDVLENLREIVKFTERNRNGMNQSLKKPLKLLYSKMIDQVHSYMYAGLYMWFKDLYNPPYDVQEIIN